VTEKDRDEPVIIPINGTLDLHGFQPREVKELVLEYIDECVRLGIRECRIVHGKGRGTLREIVHSILRKHPNVSSFSIGVINSGGWGSTSFSLAPKNTTNLEAF
jgi:dsDNA-specific endonuclease/ATPase MutS2